MAEKEILIGFMVDEFSSSFTKELLFSIQKALTAYPNVRLIVIGGHYNEGEDLQDGIHMYRSIYNAVYRLEEQCRPDGLILSLGSATHFKEQHIPQNFLVNFNHVPKVYIATGREGVISVNYDNEPGIREAVECLVNAYGFTDICMLGGREDNADAQERKRIFIKCLQEKGIPFEDKQYEATNMSEDCEREASRLLNRNPLTQAVFCVNDAVAKGLYQVMDQKGMVPGKDIMVVGFDNSRMAGDMRPPLASIGGETDALGQKALKLLMEQLAGREPRSVYISTRLYGRESLPYERYEYTTKELSGFGREFILKMFDDCFYRYRTVHHSREEVDLKALFYEVISRMLTAMRRRYMSPEEFREIGRMIDIFYEKGAMEYTDPDRLLLSIEKLQIGMNIVQRAAASNVMNNRLFGRMKDAAIRGQAEQVAKEKLADQRELEDMHRFLIEATPFHGTGDGAMERMLQNFDRLGFRNAALYLYDSPVAYDARYVNLFPENIRLMCGMRDGELYVPEEERRESPVAKLLRREELSVKCKGYVAFPVFYSYYIYGALLCELTPGVLERGEYIASQIGRAVFINDAGW